MRTIHLTQSVRQPTVKAAQQNKNSASKAIHCHGAVK